MKPVWLLDVDGVINIDGRSPWRGSGRTHRSDVTIIERGRERTFTMHWAPELIDEIRDIHVSKLAEVVWCTTWCDWAGTLETLWELPALRRAFPGGGYQSMTPAKVAAAQREYRDGRPLIWTDDDAFVLGSPLHRELIANRYSLLIRPNPVLGLTPRHILDIRGFCRAYQGE